MPNAKCKKSNKGFTLIEVSIVVLIMVIITGISWQAIRVLQPSLRLSSVSRDIVTDLRYAQQEAVTEQVDYGIRISSSTNEYQIVNYGTNQTILEKTLPAGISFSEIIGFSEDEVVFNPYGAAKEAGSITLINTKGETKTIEVRPSGFVKIED